MLGAEEVWAESQFTIYFNSKNQTQWAKSLKNSLKECVFDSKYSAILSKIHSYTLLLRRFCPLGKLVRVNLQIVERLI